jgi:hypothetical protein
MHRAGGDGWLEMNVTLHRKESLMYLNTDVTLWLVVVSILSSNKHTSWWYSWQLETLVHLISADFQRPLSHH